MRTGLGVRRRAAGAKSGVSLVSVVVVTQLVIALVTATVVYVGWRHLDANLQAGDRIAHTREKHVPKRDRQVRTEPLNILVLGTDSRAGRGDRSMTRLGATAPTPRFTCTSRLTGSRHTPSPFRATHW